MASGLHQGPPDKDGSQCSGRNAPASTSTADRLLQLELAINHEEAGQTVELLSGTWSCQDGASLEVGRGCGVCVVSTCTWST